MASGAEGESPSSRVAESSRRRRTKRRGRAGDIARNTEHVFHNMDGTISEKNSHGDDPYPPPG
jgi:hypothetical protein